MGPWWEAYGPHRRTADAGLRDVEAPEVVIQTLSQAVEGTLRDYLTEQHLPQIREVATASAHLCLESLPMLRALPQPEPPKKARSGRLRGWDPLWVPLGLSAVLMVYLFLNGQTWPALLTAVNVILWLVLLRRPEHQGAQKAQPGLSKAQVLRALDAMMLETDRCLERLEMLAGQQAAARLPEMDSEVLEAVQMLAEAQGAGDGDYALKALPGLFAGLLRKQVALRDYGADRAGDFDLFPSLTGGRTIRPAVYLEDRLILRGQATERVQDAQEVRHA